MRVVRFSGSPRTRNGRTIVLRRLRIENLVLIREAELTFAPGLNAITGETGAGKTILAQAIGLLLGARGDAAYVGPDGTRPTSRPSSTAARLLRGRGAGRRSPSCVRRTRTGSSSPAASSATAAPAPTPGDAARRGRISRWRPSASSRCPGSSSSGDSPGPRTSSICSTPSAGEDQQRRRAELRLAWRELGAARRRHDELEHGAAAAESRLAELRALVEDTEGFAPDAEETLRGRARASAPRDRARRGCRGGRRGARAGGRRGRCRPRRGRRAGARAARAARPGARARRQRAARRRAAAPRDGLGAARDSSPRSRPSQTGSSRSSQSSSESRRRSAASAARATRSCWRGRRRRARSSRRSTGAPTRRPLRLGPLAEAEDAVGALAAELRAARAGGRRALRGRASPRSCAGSAWARASSGSSFVSASRSPSGADEVAFLIRPNAGLPFAPAAETASGGELSRIALAIAAVGGGETMVFDEIDAGIGGQTAHAVGETLRRLAERAQVHHDHAPAADRQPRRPPLPRREGAGDPTHTTIEELERRRAPRRARADARRRAVHLRGAGAMSFVEFTGRARLDRRTKNLVEPARAGRRRDHRPPGPRPRLGRGARSSPACASSSTSRASQSGRYPEPGPAAARARRRPPDRRARRAAVRRRQRRRATSPCGARASSATARVSRTAARSPPRSSRGRSREQRGRVTEALEGFAENTMRYLREEGRLLAEGVEFPPLETRFRDRHALVVARGPGYKRDLAIVRPYVRDFKPVLVAVDGGADALLAAGMKPARDRRRHGLRLRPRASLRGGARRPRLPRRAGAGRRAARAARRSRTRPSRRPGSARTSRCCSRFEKGAELIVAVGTHFNLTEFLERDRARNVVDLRDAAEGGGDPHRREGRVAARQPAGRPLAAGRCSRSPASARSSSPSSPRPALRNFIGLLSQRIRGPARPRLATGHFAPSCRTHRSAASCSRRARTSGSSSPSRTTSPTGGPASEACSPTAAASPRARAGRSTAGMRPSSHPQAAR